MKNDSVICEKCKYNNKIYNVEKYGTCTRCGSVIDAKAKFKYEMYKKLRLWRNKNVGIPNNIKKI